MVAMPDAIDDRDDSPPGAKPTLRWFQFRLRTLLVLLALMASLLVAWRVYLEPYRRQQQTIELIKTLGGRVVTVESRNWLRWLSGDDCQNVALVDVADRDDPAEYLNAVVALPALETLVVGGPGFGDEQLRSLHCNRTLTGLVLDCTGVTAEGLAELRRTAASLEIYRSQRRAVAAIGGQRTMITFRPETSRLVPLSKELEAKIGFEHLSEADACVVDGGDDEMLHVRHLGSLEGLHLEGIRITDAGLIHVPGLLNLRRLTLHSTRITDAGLANLAGLKNIEVLSLQGTHITDDGLVHLKALPHLHHLSLARTRITDAAHLHVRHLHGLEHLDAQGARITELGAAMLREALPHCWVRAGLTRIIHER
jgi:hypothetical protein